jgi:hypothetical protein
MGDKEMNIKLTSLVLAVIMACQWPAHADAPKPKPKEPEVQESWMLAALLVTAALAGAAIVIYIHNKHGKPSQSTPVNVVLEKSSDNVNWTPVATNRVVLNGTDPYEIYREYRKDGHSFYRVRVQ